MKDNDLLSLVDEVGSLESKLKHAREALRKALLAAGGGESIVVEGDVFEANFLVYDRNVTNWKNLAMSYRPSPQKLTAYRRTEKRRDVRVTLRPDPEVFIGREEAA